MFRVTKLRSFLTDCYFVGYDSNTEFSGLSTAWQISLLLEANNIFQAITKLLVMSLLFYCWSCEILVVLVILVSVSFWQIGVILALRSQNVFIPFPNGLQISLHRVRVGNSICIITHSFNSGYLFKVKISLSIMMSVISVSCEYWQQLIWKVFLIVFICLVMHGQNS